jgi:hypothetical protein
LNNGEKNERYIGNREYIEEPMRGFFNRENYFIPKEFGGNGAGNNLGKEYDTAGVPHDD